MFYRKAVFCKVKSAGIACFILRTSSVLICLRQAFITRLFSLQAEKSIYDALHRRCRLKRTMSVLEAHHISVSQQSFNSLTENFAKFITLLESESTYTPNETHLKSSTLKTLLENMRTTNTTVIDTHVDLNSTRISRNDLLYKNKSSLVHTAQEVKKYIKSVFGALSPQAKQITKI